MDVVSSRVGVPWSETVRIKWTGKGEGKNLPTTTEMLMFGVGRRKQSPNPNPVTRIAITEKCKAFAILLAFGWVLVSSVGA